MSLPPGQQSVGYFPRFGIPSGASMLISEPPVVRIEGAVARRLQVPVSRLRELARRTIIADFHCVAGWTTQDLRWAGVTFRTFYETIIVPEAKPRSDVSYVVFRGADGYHSCVMLEDALADDVLLADQLEETALTRSHGAPLRLVSPKQYGHKSTKHLCCIELHTRKRNDGHERAIPNLVLALLGPRPRARVSEEERHHYLPAWAVRGIYRRFIRSITTRRSGGS